MYGKLSIFQACEVIQRHVTHTQGICLGRSDIWKICNFLHFVTCHPWQEFSWGSRGMFPPPENFEETGQEARICSSLLIVQLSWHGCCFGGQGTFFFLQVSTCLNEHWANN